VLNLVTKRVCILANFLRIWLKQNKSDES